MKLTKYASKWITRADEDFQAAEILLREGGPANAICFHAQQAAEKYLKGFLAHQEKHVRKIHDLEALKTECQEIDGNVSALDPDVKYLKRFYVEARYPGNFPEFSLEEGRKAIAAAKQVKDFVTSLLDK